MSLRPPVTLSDFDAQFRAVERRLHSQLTEVRAQLRDSGSKGANAEGAFRDALAQYLPRRLEIGRGEVIDTHGHRSAPCDLVVASDHHPNWFGRHDPSLFLIEAVAAVAEVKSLLTSDHLTTTLENTKRFRSLRPDWSGHTETVGTQADLDRYYRSPPFFMFAYESQLTLETICERLQAATDPDSERSGESLDGVFVLDRGFVLNFGGGGGSFVVQGPDGDRLTGYYWDDKKSPLLALMSWLPTALSIPVTQMPVLSKYLLADAPPSVGHRTQT